MDKNQQTSNAFVKELNKIGEEALMKILSDLALLEEIVLSGEQVTKKHGLDVKLITTDTDKVMQLTSGQYRIWYEIKDGTVHYVKIFKKQKNGTPNRFKSSIRKLVRKSIPAEKVKVKETLESLKIKSKSDSNSE